MQKTISRFSGAGVNRSTTAGASDASQRAGASVPIVGVGASTRELSAFKGLRQRLPTDTAIAFVLAQHLDPHRESMLVELLRRQTRGPVVEAGEGIRIEASGDAKAPSSIACPAETASSGGPRSDG